MTWEDKLRERPELQDTPIEELDLNANEGLLVITMPETSKYGGDVRESWDKDDPEDIQRVKAIFDELTSQGYTAYRRKRLGRRGEVMTEFDPKAEAVILCKPLAGG